jgi:Kef-type K+ transport system membrane component KefB
MNKKGSLFYYLLTLAFSGSFIYFIVRQGYKLEKSGSHVLKTIPVSPVNQTAPLVSFQHNLTHPLPVLLLQILVILIIAKLFGFLFNNRLLRQPAVVGEIVAGIVLGPSVFGLLFPGLSGFIFPPTSLGNLQFLSQVGLILFMFVIGLELELHLIAKQAYAAVIISHSSIIIPYTLGMGLAYFLYQEFAPPNISFLSFALFMGIAMSITAFPVLARIIREKGLTKTKLGTISLTCAATNDVTAWCILAIVIGVVRAGSATGAWFTIAFTICYTCLMLFLIKPLLQKMGNRVVESGTLKKSLLAFLFMVLLLSSYIAESIGIHALFGAFLAGVIMPESPQFRKLVIEKIEDLSVVLLLPLFFVFTGLRTQIGLLNNLHLWTVCSWIILTAVAGKFGGSAISSRITGQGWRDSLSIGALMNTRGLMELVILNIGYELGILSASIFAMLVLMALVTTFMTCPALDLINRKRTVS